MSVFVWKIVFVVVSRKLRGRAPPSGRELVVGQVVDVVVVVAVAGG